MMELLVFIAVLIALAALADRFGADSRDNLWPHEAEFAKYGLVSEQRTRSGNSTISTLSEEGM
jgi:hypothetical protein